MKLILPTVLIATALVAGIFALMPVETATSVHTTIAANVTDQSRTLYFHTDSGAAGDLNEVIIPLALLQAFEATGTLSSAGGACVLEDSVGPTALITGVDGTVVLNTFGNANASTTQTTDFDNGEDIVLDTPANTSCYLTLLITEFD